jgi:ABC-2 type transport system ATP-binding protein
VAPTARAFLRGAFGRLSSCMAHDVSVSPMAAASPAVEVNNLVVRYGSLTAVDGLSLRAHLGEVVAVLGPNGAGKTSAIETMEGFRRPDEGSVRVLGLDPVADHRVLAPKIGVMLQQGGLYPTMSPRQALSLFSSYYDSPDDPDALIDLVGLQQVSRTPYRRLSGGEQRRLSLALALVGRPEVAFLDEPTSGVDLEGRLAIRSVMRSLAERGCCVLVATHELDEADRVADRVVIFDRGHVVAEGSPAELKGSFGASSLEDVFLAALRR